jgi:hypothetical protein
LAGAKPEREVFLRKVHTAESILEVAHLRNVLEGAGIACFVRNEGLAGVLGEIPFVECWPELWVVRNGEALRAQGLIDTVRAAAVPQGPDWTCDDCGERVEGQFDACWHCAATDEAGSV